MSEDCYLEAARQSRQARVEIVQTAAPILAALIASGRDPTQAVKESIALAQQFADAATEEGER